MSCRPPNKPLIPTRNCDAPLLAARRRRSFREIEVVGNGTLKIAFDPDKTNLTIPDELYMGEPMLALVK